MAEGTGQIQEGNQRKEIKTQINRTRTMKEVAEWATLPATDAPVVMAEAGTP